MTDILSPKFGPYCGIIENTLHRITHTPKKKKRTFRILAYRCYNAGGLYGSEFNGIAILDEDKKEVLLDNHSKASSGYSLSEAVVKSEIKRLKSLDAEAFAEFIRTHYRSRKPDFQYVKPRVTYKDPIRRTATLLLGPDMGYAGERQEQFYKWGRKACERVAKLLKLPKGSFQIRVNRGGIAVSGEITLHHEKFYLQWSQGLRSMGILLRSCDGLDDYTGGRNQMVDLEEIAENEMYLVAEIQALLRRQHYYVDA